MSSALALPKKNRGRKGRRSPTPPSSSDGTNSDNNAAAADTDSVDSDDDHIVHAELKSSKCSDYAKPLLRAPAVHIPEYNGVGQFETWLEDTEETFICMGLSNSQRLTYLPHLLTGKAKRIHRNLPKTDKQSYTKMIKALTEQLGFQYRDVITTAPELSFKQTINMDVAAYTEEMLSRFDKAHIFSKSDRMRRFYDGLRDEIKSKLHLLNCENMAALERSAIMAERASVLENPVINEVRAGFGNMERQIKGFNDSPANQYAQQASNNSPANNSYNNGRNYGGPPRNESRSQPDRNQNYQSNTRYQGQNNGGNPNSYTGNSSYNSYNGRGYNRSYNSRGNNRSNYSRGYSNSYRGRGRGTYQNSYRGGNQSQGNNYYGNNGRNPTTPNNNGHSNHGTVDQSVYTPNEARKASEDADARKQVQAHANFPYDTNCKNCGMYDHRTSECNQAPLNC